jgi:hypothetical protein
MAVHSPPAGAWRRVLAQRARRRPVDHVVLAAIGCVLAALVLYAAFLALGGDGLELDDGDEARLTVLVVAAGDAATTYGREGARADDPVRWRRRRCE